MQTHSTINFDTERKKLLPAESSIGDPDVGVLYLSPNYDIVI